MKESFMMLLETILGYFMLEIFSGIIFHMRIARG